MLSDEALEEHKEFYSSKNRECTYHQIEKNLHKMVNSSKSTDQVLWLVVLLQLIDKSIMFLKNNAKFDSSNIDDYDQPLIPGATKIESTYFKHAVKLLETY